MHVLWEVVNVLGIVIERVVLDSSFSVVATTIKNANVALIFSFLHRIVEVRCTRDSLQGLWMELKK